MLATPLKEETVVEKETTELEKAAAASGTDQQTASFTKTEDVRRPARFD